MSVTELTEAKGTSEEKASPVVTDSSGEPDDLEYVQGARLYLVLGALTVVFFLIMLDNTILATVRLNLERPTRGGMGSPDLCLPY